MSPWVRAGNTGTVLTTRATTAGRAMTDSAQLSRSGQATPQQAHFSVAGTADVVCMTPWRTWSIGDADALATPIPCAIISKASKA